MTLGWAIAIGAGAMIVFVNVVATRRLWASEVFETSQKIAQTALVWLLPGTVLVVWNILRERRIGSAPDSTVDRSVGLADWLLSSSARRDSESWGAEQHGAAGGDHTYHGGAHGHDGGHDGGSGGGHGGGGDGGGHH